MNPQNQNTGLHGAGRRCLHLWLLLLGVAFAAAPAVASRQIDLENGETVFLERRDVDVRIDGQLDEPVWDELPYYDEFVVTDPDTLVPTRFATRVRIFHTAKGLYVGMDMEQPAETIISRLSGRDVWPLTRDGVGFTLDTSGTGRYGYWFDLYLGDSVSDGTVLPERQFSSDWDGPWRGATAITDSGWSAEFLIPWGTVAMPQSDQARRMGIALNRKVAYIEERWNWPALPMTKPQYMSALQTMQMEGVAPRQQYNFYPYSSVTVDEYENDTELNVGADFFWRPSSNFQLNATVNPDFGAVESDDVVINLSATETFFPEKRLFFLEGQEIFNATPRADTRSRGIGNRGSPYTMVNSRRIGGKPDDPGFPDDYDVGDRDLNKPVDLFGAFKTTGQVGSLRYGVLGAFEDQARFEVRDDMDELTRESNDGNDYGVARLLWENNSGGRYKALGVLSTAVIGGEGRDAYAQGVDWHYYTENAKLKMDGQAFTSDVDGEGVGYGGFMDFEYSFRQGVTQRVGFEYMDDQIDLNDLGFLERNDYWQIRSSHSRSTSELGWARQNRFDARGAVRMNLDGDLVRSGIFLSDALTFHSFDSVHFGASYFFTSYDDLNSFGNGTFRIKDKLGLSVDYHSDTTKNFSWGVGAGFHEEDLGSDSYSGAMSLSWRPSDRFSAGFRLKYQDREGWLLHQEGIEMATFNAEQWQPVFNVEYFISAKQQLRMSLQWVGIKARGDDVYLIPDDGGSLIKVDDPADPPGDFSIAQLSYQARYRWEIAPLSDLFIVYTRISDLSDQLDDETFQDLFQDSWEDPFANVFIVKLRYRFGS